LETKKTDDFLSQRLKANDQSAFQTVFQMHYASVCKTIRRFIHDTNTVEDLAQDVFVRFWERRHQIEVKTSFGAYLYRMGVNEALTYIRKQKRFQEDDIDGFSFSDNSSSAIQVMEGAELKVKIKAAIDSLPPKCRTVFLLSRQEEMSYKEIADKLEISIKTVENQIGKALKVMRAYLKDDLLGWLILMMYLL
jgi:RNA polymerase sigma-70 factor (ECF subfamily)